MGFWGVNELGEPYSKEEWLANLRASNRQGLENGVKWGWWVLDPEGNPMRPPIQISKGAMETAGKPLMAHLMVDLGFFQTVTQARKNGWDRPLELGTQSLGPKKSRITVDIIP